MNITRIKYGLCRNATGDCIELTAFNFHILALDNNNPPSEQERGHKVVTPLGNK